MKTKPIIPEIIKYATMLLMVYAAVSKLAIYDTFLVQLHKSPLLPRSLDSAIAWGIPSLELIIALLLFIPRLQKTGFFLAFFLMFTFTLYLSALYFLFPFDEIPCSCGGILGKMSYPVHIVFNLAFTLLTLLGFFWTPQHTQKSPAPIAR